MLFQYDIEGFEWIIGLGLMFGLAFYLMMRTNRTIVNFYVFFTIFNAYVVWAGLLELWTLILNMIVLFLIIVYQITKGKVT